ncbi:aldehyde dehydrogenase family protein, partial [Acinetobacter baumannii]|nr:aldehyde dehydrogenase family protein [Acinetobacter baumannii]
VLEKSIKLTKELTLGNTVDNTYMGPVINKKQFDKIKNYIEIGKEEGKLEQGGGTDDSKGYFVEPTIISGLKSKDRIMQEEIFGPILPILTYQSLDEAIAFIHQRPKPLSLYLFSEDENATQRVLNELSFGGGAINDTLMHLSNPKLPFGGVGASGMGRYHGKYSFDTFTHEKSYIFKSTRLESGVHL